MTHLLEILLVANIFLTAGNLSVVVARAWKQPSTETVEATIAEPEAIPTSVTPAPLVQCEKCNNVVARYTPTATGHVCANCQPL